MGVARGISRRHCVGAQKRATSTKGLKVEGYMYAINLICYQILSDCYAITRGSLEVEPSGIMYPLVDHPDRPIRVDLGGNASITLKTGPFMYHPFLSHNSYIITHSSFPRK